MTLVYIYVALASYNTGYLTLPMSSIENVVDEAADIAVLDSKGRIKRKLNGELIAPQRPPGSAIDVNTKGLDWNLLWSEGTDAVMDVPVGGVCEILYGSNI